MKNPFDKKPGPGTGPGRGDKGGSAGNCKGPGTKNPGWAGKAPPKGKGPKGGGKK